MHPQPDASFTSVHHQDPHSDEFGLREIHARTEDTYSDALRTLRNYTEKKRRLPDQSLEEPVPYTMTDLVDDLLTRTDILRSTFKLYRAALLWHVRTQASTGRTRSIREEAAELVVRLEETLIPGGLPKAPKEPGWIPEEDYNALIAFLQERGTAGSIWSDRTCSWVMAGVITGLRPGEWQDAHWSTEDPNVLVAVTGKAHLFEPRFVRNAKEIQPPGPREIPIRRKFDREVVDTHLAYFDWWVRGWAEEQLNRRPGRPAKKNGPGFATPLPPRESLSEADIEAAYKAYYMSCRDVLRHACLAMWTDRLYSLYSCRDQFSANIRSSMGPAEAAALMGHSRPDSPSAAAYAAANGAHSRYRAAGAERLKNEGPQMDPQLREQLAQRRIAQGDGQAPDDAIPTDGGA